MDKITITEDEYRDLCRTADTLEWLQSRGVCWRGVDEVFPCWRVGDETEWHYSCAGDIRDKVDAHRSILANVKGLPPNKFGGVVTNIEINEATRVLSELNHRVHTSYDFNRDPDSITRLVGAALNGDERIYDVWPADDSRWKCDFNKKKYMILEPHQKRVINEKVELDEKILKLRSFIKESPTFASLQDEEKELLMHQHYFMCEYSSVLEGRIKLFTEIK